MSVRRRTTAACWGLALGLLALVPDRCPAAQVYQPVFGDPMLEPWRWRTFLELSGLDAQCMTEAADGTMWFGTANGLWSYNGIEWTDHSSNTALGRVVTTLCSLPDGDLYAGGSWGISHFSNGRWQRLLSDPEKRVIEIEELPVRKLAIGRDGALWAATSWGALHYWQSTWTLYADPDTAARLQADRSLPFPNVVVRAEASFAGIRSAPVSSPRAGFTEIVADAHGTMWFGTAEGDVACYVPAPAPSGAMPDEAHGTWSIHGESAGVLAGQITSILPMQDDSVWVVHAGSEHANVFDRQAWRSIRLPHFLPALDLGDAGGKLLQTRDGVVWLLARYMIFAFRDGQWQKYGQQDLPYPSTRNAVIQSADGALWFAGANNEIYRVDYQTPRWLTLEDLNFQWASPTGAQWFLHREGRVVVREGGRWTSYGAEDGLIDTPVAVLGTRRGEVWAAGSHERTAATARFDGRTWTRELHPDFSFAVEWRASFASSDGSVWFGAFVDTDGPAKYRYGLLQFRDGVWRHHHQPGRSPRADGAEDPATLLPPSNNPHRPIEKFICMGESRDGKFWAGRNILAFYERERWTEFVPPLAMRPSNIETAFTTREGHLWVGTREAGALRYDGEAWQQFQGKDSLLANSVRSLTQTTDGSIWAATDRGFSRFDGRAWMSDVLPEQLGVPHEGGDLRASPSGQLWINRYTLYWMRRAWSKSPPPDPNGEFRTVCHEFQGPPPRTSITAGPEVVSQPGNLAVLWSGIVPWRDPKNVRLQFSFRLDDEPWSAFTSDRGHSFFTVPHGAHRLEVRARDQDFNVDPTPATLEFVVLPPVWRQGWFIILMFLLGGLIVAQTVRVMLEQGRLRRAHDELEVRVHQRTAELEAANRELEAFSYSVSHDLRTPLRSIDGFSQALLDDYADKLDDDGKSHLRRVRAATHRMGQLIEDMLKLSRVTRSELRTAPVNLSNLAQEILNDLARRDSDRQVSLSIAPEIVVNGDGNLLRIALENLLGNAWKFTAKRAKATIEFGWAEQGGERVYFVRDDGAGFDMAYANKLFGAFQRLHSPKDFPGTGVGLAIVQRVINRHGGRVWAEAAVDGGATFFFTLGNRVAS